MTILHQLDDIQLRALQMAIEKLSVMEDALIEAAGIAIWRATHQDSYMMLHLARVGVEAVEKESKRLNRIATSRAIQQPG